MRADPFGDLARRPGVRHRPVAHRLLGCARAVGAEGALRRAQQALASPTARRSMRDEVLMRAMLPAALRGNGCCVDIGASVGDVLEQVVCVAPAGRHIAFEPVPEAAAVLRARFPEVDVRETALGACPGRAAFEFLPHDPQLSGLRPPGADPRAGAEELLVDVTDLDDALPADYVPAVLKIDVEGAEHAVLSGAAGTIRRHRPLVIFEHRARNAVRYGIGPRDVYALVSADLGLRIFDLEGDGPYTTAEFERRVRRDERWNFVARG